MSIDRSEKNWWVSRAKKKKIVNMYIYYVQTLYQTYMTLAPTWYLENITQSTHMFFSLILSGSDLITGLYICYIWLLQTSRPDKHREEKTQPAFSSQLYSIFSRRSGFHIRTEGVAFDLSYNQVIKSFCLSVHIILYLTLYFVPPKLVRPYYFYFIFISLLLSLSNLSKRQPCKLPL